MIDAKTLTDVPDRGRHDTASKFAEAALVCVDCGACCFGWLCVASRSFAADEMIAAGAAADFIPGSDRASTRPPATFFSINAVLAKLDRQRGRGPDAVRLASLTPSNVATDAQPPLIEAPAVGKEPFGLFTFRAPEGLLWRKWRGVEAAMKTEQTVLDHCRTGAEGCPSHAAQFLRLINAVKSKSGRARLEEANRAVNMAIRYVSDQSQHGESDRWSAPLATFATAKGDCEDYAIAKYAVLREAGFAPISCDWCWFATAPCGRTTPCWPRVSTSAG